MKDTTIQAVNNRWSKVGLELSKKVGSRVLLHTVANSSAAHTIALYENGLREQFAADLEFEDISPTSKAAKMRIYAGIVEVEKYHRNLVRTDFHADDSYALNCLGQELRQSSSITTEEILDMSELEQQQEAFDRQRATLGTLGYDPDDNEKNLAEIREEQYS